MNPLDMFGHWPTFDASIKSIFKDVEEVEKSLNNRSLPHLLDLEELITKPAWLTPYKGKYYRIRVEEVEVVVKEKGEVGEEAK